jgi:hypothetical protein
VSIGNSLNSLPLAYAAMGGAGRYVAYALAGLAAEAAVSPSGHAIFDGAAQLTTTTAAAPVGLRIAPSSVALVASSTHEAVGMKQAGGAVSISANAVVETMWIKTTYSAIVLTAATSALAAVPFRIRNGACDFTEEVFDLVALVAETGDTLITEGGDQLSACIPPSRRSFVVQCVATGNVVAGGKATLTGPCEVTPRGNVLRGADCSFLNTAALEGTPNAVFGPSMTLAGQGAAAPFAMALRSGAVTFALSIVALVAETGDTLITEGGDQLSACIPPSATMLASGSLFAGARTFLSTEAVAVILAGIIGDASAALVGEIRLATEGNILVAPVAIMDCTLGVGASGDRWRCGSALLAAEAAAEAVPWDPLSCIISYVYADVWDQTLGCVSAVSIILFEDLETIVYQSIPESIVYGEIH